MDRNTITTLLDLAGLLLLAAGAGALAYPLLGWGCVAAAGVVLLAGSRVILWIAAPAAAPSWWRWLSRHKEKKP